MRSKGYARRRSTRSVSASDLAQMGVCERLVVFEDRHGQRRTTEQRRAIQRGVRAHHRFYCERYLDPASRGRCFVATLVFGPTAPETIVLRRFRDRVMRPWWIGRWLIRNYYELAPAVCDRLRKWPAAKRLVCTVLRPIVWCAARWVNAVGRRDGT